MMGCIDTLRSFLDGNRDKVFKREILKDYVEFLNKWIKSDLTDNQKKLFHSAMKYFFLVVCKIRFDPLVEKLCIVLQNFSFENFISITTQEAP